MRTMYGGPIVSVCNHKGFSLIEMLIALAVGSLLLATVINTFINQRETYAIREQVVAMQDNARGGLNLMVRDLAMAGYDPTGTSGAGIAAAGEQSIHVTMDLNSDGKTDDAGEDVTYALYNVDGDGDLALGRNVGGGNQLVAANIQNLALRYTLADGTSTTNPTDPNQIRTIDVTLTARTARPDQQYAKNNGHRTLRLTTTVRVRNLGL